MTAGRSSDHMPSVYRDRWTKDQGKHRRIELRRLRPLRATGKAGLVASRLRADRSKCAGLEPEARLRAVLPNPVTHSAAAPSPDKSIQGLARAGRCNCRRWLEIVDGRRSSFPRRAK